MVLVGAWEMAGAWERGIDITKWKTGRIFNLGLEKVSGVAVKAGVAVAYEGVVEAG
jgi:hypothetical protein